MSKNIPIGLLLCALALFALGSTAVAHPGGMDTPDPVLPPPGVYLTPDDVHAMYSGQSLTIVLSAIQHQPFKDRLPEHFGTNNENHDFQSTVQGMVECIGDCGMFPPGQMPFTANGRVQTVAFNKPPGMVTGSFDTEMLAMSLTGTGGVMIRESPTKASTGKTSIQDIGGGMYHIDSFFDVFTELSLDGGQTWMPKLGPRGTRVVLGGVPEPASFVLVSLGLLGVSGFARRRK